MPVVFDEANWEYWLDPESKGVEGLLSPWTGEMACHRVAQRMNDGQYEEKDAVEAIESRFVPVPCSALQRNS